MSLLTRLAPYLPYLRRYGRALTGDPVVGDGYVRAALETLAAGEAESPAGTTAKTGLYTVFHQVLRASGAALEPHGDGAMRPATSPARQAFLLTALEGFTPGEAAKILDVPFEATERLIAQAQAEIDAAPAADVLIIEDEPVIAADIEALARELGHTVTGIAATRDEAAAAAARHPPGLVLTDIQLADGSSGIDAARDILAETGAPAVFVTAFPERLLTGERPEPAFLVVKPFQPETLKAAIGQALFLHPARPPASA